MSEAFCAAGGNKAYVYTDLTPIITTVTIDGTNYETRALALPDGLTWGKIKNFMFASNLSFMGTVDTYTYRKNPSTGKLEELATGSNLGWNVVDGNGFMCAKQPQDADNSIILRYDETTVEAVFV